MHTNTSTGIVALDATAVRVSVDLVAGMTAADLARPTPCADWTLHGLLRHMIAQHYGFAAAAAGDGDLANWMLRPLGPDPVADYRAAASCVLDAFAADGALDREFPLPELKLGLAFPGRQAITFHFIDYVVHSRDVAATLGLTGDLEFDPALVDAARRVAQMVPGGAFRTDPGAAFAPAVGVAAAQLGGAAGAGLDEVLAQLGRSPRWSAGSVPSLPD